RGLPAAAARRRAAVYVLEADGGGRRAGAGLGEAQAPRPDRRAGLQVNREPRSRSARADDVRRGDGAVARVDHGGGLSEGDGGGVGGVRGGVSGGGGVRGTREQAMADMSIRTPETHPKDPVVGKRFKFFGVVYFCDSYDPSCGYWMTNENDP